MFESKPSVCGKFFGGCQLFRFARIIRVCVCVYVCVCVWGGVGGNTGAGECGNLNI